MRVRVLRLQGREFDEVRFLLGSSSRSKKAHRSQENAANTRTAHDECALSFRLPVITNLAHLACRVNLSLPLLTPGATPVRGRLLSVAGEDRRLGTVCGVLACQGLRGSPPVIELALVAAVLWVLDAGRPPVPGPRVALAVSRTHQSLSTASLGSIEMRVLHTARQEAAQRSSSRGSAAGVRACCG